MKRKACHQEMVEEILNQKQRILTTQQYSRLRKQEFEMIANRIHSKEHELFQSCTTRQIEESHSLLTPASNRRAVKSARKISVSEPPSIHSEDIDHTDWVIDLTSEEEAKDAEDDPSVLAYKDSVENLKQSRRSTRDTTECQNQDIDLECNSFIEMSDNVSTQEIKNNNEFMICLNSKPDIKKKKIEYLKELIRDEFRTDYLGSEKILTKKVKEIYEKFHDFENSLPQSDSGFKNKKLKHVHSQKTPKSVRNNQNSVKKSDVITYIPQSKFAHLNYRYLDITTRRQNYPFGCLC